MSKSEMFRLRIQRESHHYRHRKVEEIRQENEKEFKDEVDRFRRGNDHSELGPPVHEEQPPVRRGPKG